MMFRKTLHFPEYAGLSDETLNETHGDLTALEGTRVDLTLEVDQDVEEAELRWQAADADEVVSMALVPDGQRHFHAAMTIDAPAVYSVHLVSRETGFTNKFSPKYEVHPLPDLVPRTGFVDQQESTLLLPPNDILPLRAMAEDDLPLVRLDQQYSINGGPWQLVNLPVESSRHVTTDWQWDLLTLNLKSGDQLLTRLVATDRKGNEGQSVPLRIVVSAPDFDPDRHAVALLKSQFYDDLAEFADRFAEHKSEAVALIDRVRKTDDATRAAGDLAGLSELAARERAESDKLLDRTLEVLRQMPAGADAYELDLVGRVVGRIEYEYAHTPDRLLEKLGRENAARGGAEEQKLLENTCNQLQQVFDRSEEGAQRLAQLYRDLMAHNVLAAIAWDLDALLRQQRLAAETGTATWERLTRQERVVLNQFRLLQQLVEDQRSRLPESTHRSLAEYVEWIESCRFRLQQGMESPDKLPQLRRTAAALLNELAQRQRVDVLDWRISNSLVSARQDFNNRSGTVFVPLQELGGRANELYGRLMELKQSGDTAGTLRIQHAMELTAIDLAAFQVAARGQLRVRRDLTQARNDGDAQYAVDAGLTRRAVNALCRSHQEDPLAEPLLQQAMSEIAPAYRILEAGHEAAAVRNALDGLLASERWESQDINARLDHPRQWEALASLMELAARRLQEAGVPGELVEKIHTLRWSPVAREAARKITDRRTHRDSLVSAGYELSELQTQWRQLRDQLDPVMAEARAVIARYAPTISSMAQQAADDAHALREQTLETADREDSQQATEEAALDGLQADQKSINEQIEDLIDALVEDANRTDLLDDQQRERARDADASIARIRQASAEMNQALEEAVKREVPDSQADRLAEAAETQDKAAATLQLVSDHFGRLDAGKDITQTRAAIRPPANGDDQQLAADSTASSEVGLLDERYASAEDLAHMARQSPQELLRQLEAELHRNPAMQKSLSRISKETLEQAKNALDDSAREDDQMQRQIEREDPRFQTRKRQLIQDLKRLSQEAANTANRLVAQANSAANQGKIPESAKKLTSTQQELRQVYETASRLNDNSLLSEVRAAADEINEKLHGSASQLAVVKAETKAAEKSDIHDDQKARASAQRAFERVRDNFQNQRVRWTRDAARRTRTRNATPRTPPGVPKTN